ncbi:phage tail spike protein [uncultured Ligilactobacillus sp.]|uniref:phage tail spike protein n=1 Tax=uncultured Ligilactobacillus sp. TaxID=2837633 RepID=UPI00272AD7D4|nr:phage tail spike protein [uncultured Ligilactobacillus sp.]
MIMYLLDKQQNIIKAISDGIIEAKMTEEINAADKLSFSLVQNKRLASNIYYVCIPSTRGNAFLMFKIISESVKDDRIEYTCIESAYDELKSYAYIKDLRPQDKTAGEMLQIALAGTRWETGYLAGTTRKRTNFYYISTLEAIQKIVEVFKVELTFSVVIDPLTNRITRRQANLYDQQGERTGKRFEYGSNLLSVIREESSEDLVTALVGRGKGEQLDDGNDDTVDGYGRRIMFTDVVWSKAKGNPTDKPAGQEYVEDKEATKLYGFDDGKPRIGIAVFEDIDDVNQLINATWSALQVAKRPKVSFKASALDVGDLGLGDTVAIIRHELGIEYFTRVYKVEHDLLDKNNNVIELGDDFSEKSLTNYVASVKEAQEETSRVANIALTSANGKNKNFYSNVKPTIAAEGDNLFLDLGNGGTEYYVWRNGNWELILSTVELSTTKEAVNQALNDIEEVRSQANQAYNNAENAKSVADSIYQSFMATQVSLSTQISDVDIKAQEALENAKNLNKTYIDFENAINGKIDESTSETARMIAQVSNSTRELSDEAKQQQKAIANLITSVDGVKGQYATLDGRVTQFNAGIDGLNAQLRDAKGQLVAIKVTADGTATNLANAQGDIASVRAKANLLEQQMLGKVGNDMFESFKSSTAKELSSKLTASDLNGYVKSTEFVQTANGIRASVSAVDDKLNNLNIGGANLIPNSNASEIGAVAWTGSRLFTHPFYFNGTKNMFNVDNSTTLITPAVSQRFAIKPNTQYTLSYVGFMSTNSENYNIFLRGRKGNVEKGSQFIQGGRLSAAGAEYKHVTFTTGDIDNAELAFNIGGSTNGSVANFFFNEVMLVEGNKDLRWSPAPKDAENRYASLNIEVDKINAVVANKADRSYVEQRANEIISTVSGKADWSYVNQKANEINSVVANKADIAYVNQKADQWQLELTNLAIGGTNLLEKTSSEMEIILAPTVGYQEGVRYNTTKNIDKDTYTLSFEAKAYYSGQKIANYFWYGDLGGNNTVERVIESNGVERTNPLDGFWEVTLTNSWKRYWITYKVRPEEFKKSVIVGRRFVGSSPKPQGNVFIRNVKLEQGSKPTDYSPAPEDTTVAITAVKNELNTAINLRVQKNELLSQINLQAGHTLIQSNKIYLDAETVAFSGRAFIPSAAITELNADKITAGTLNAARVNIINLDVRNITGDKTEFVRSFWRSAYGNYVNIDYSGMRVTYGNTTTKFDSSGMTIKAVGESIGGIGWQGMKGMPPNYQGLTFWLDGGGDYMAWAARDNGNYNMNPLVKMAWYRNEWRPNDTNLGFNFNDPVTLNDLVYPSGKPSDGMALKFFTTRYNGHSYPTIGSASMKAGIMFGDWDLFFLFNNKVYPLDGMKIPREINSDGTVNKWSSVNY